MDTSYIELIRKDVSYDEDTSSWPPSVSEFVKSLQGRLRLPGWLKSGPISSYTNERTRDLLEQFRASDDASRNDIWEDTEGIDDNVSQQRLHEVFDMALDDCARIRTVLETERVTGTPCPKTSFIGVLIRNAVFTAIPELTMLDDIPVALPCHFSERSNPALKYISNSLLAPLMITLCKEMPIEEEDPDLEHQLGGNEDFNSSDPSQSVTESLASSEEEESPRFATMSEFLASSGEEEESRQFVTMSEFLASPKQEEEEEEKEEIPLPPQFEAHFLASRSSTTPPSVCHIPVLCMADEEQLPVLMSSLLYQRRVWRINDPLIGVQFSKYDTVIKLYVGWVEESVPLDRVLPRVHLGEIGTPSALDLSSPSIALAVSRLLCGLQLQISGMQNTFLTENADASETQTDLSLSWRIDRDLSLPDRSSSPNLDVFKKWGYEKPDSRSSDSPKNTDISMEPKKEKPSMTVSLPKTTSQSASKSELPPMSEPDGSEETQLRTSCSRFAETGEDDEFRAYRWMFDRRVLPRCIPSDSTFRDQYEEMTCFIWPENWKTRNDLPRVVGALEPYVLELVAGVDALEKNRKDAVKRLSVEEFPVDLDILERCFSAIFQACHRAQEKAMMWKTRTKMEKEMKPSNSIDEASWRLDHDRLLFDFFIRLIRTGEGEATLTLTDKPVALLVDPSSLPTLETTLHLPGCKFMKQDDRDKFRDSFEVLNAYKEKEILDWIEAHNRPEDLDAEKLNIHELNEYVHRSFIISKFAKWFGNAIREDEGTFTSRIGRLPGTGRCDALARLLVELLKLPDDVPSDYIRKLQLVSHPATEPGGSIKGKSPAQKSTHSGRNKLSTELPKNKTCCNILSVPMEQTSPERISSMDPMNTLTPQVQKPHIGSDKLRLELPILAAEYKKASTDKIMGTNQVRMCLTASVKFLQALGIKNIPVYGVLTDGRLAALPAAVLRDDGFVHMFERLVDKFDISTPLGAWHYATILCRLAHNHAKDLEKRFNEAREGLVERIRGGKVQWTMENRFSELGIPVRNVK